MNYLRKKLEEIIRVDHAGEYGAVRIYQGQLRAFAKKNSLDVLPEIQKMKEQEDEHLNFFNKQLIEKKILSTTLLPVWHFVGYYLGYISASLGEDFAMTCTESVEDVINSHYQSQIDFLRSSQDQDDLELAEMLDKFRLEELEHKDYATNHNYNSDLANKSTRKKLNDLFGTAIKLGCKVAIAISKRI
jgi:ubiquinone biosynthesis monooxygenase Coq7